MTYFKIQFWSAGRDCVVERTPDAWCVVYISTSRTECERYIAMRRSGGAA
ncbi:MAG: hypothetical protein RIB60_07615 [Phycisphaerales bacterium]